MTDCHSCPCFVAEHVARYYGAGTGQDKDAQAWLGAKGNPKFFQILWYLDRVDVWGFAFYHTFVLGVMKKLTVGFLGKHGKKKTGEGAAGGAAAARWPPEYKLRNLPRAQVRSGLKSSRP